MSLSNEENKPLRDLTRCGVDDARVTIDCRERNGRLMTVEECEYCLSLITPSSKTLWKMFESKARKAFQRSVRDEYVHHHLAEVASREKDVQLLQANYATLRKALYLATDATICERIRREIQTRFPWGNWK